MLPLGNRKIYSLRNLTGVSAALLLAAPSPPAGGEFGSFHSINYYWVNGIATIVFCCVTHLYVCFFMAAVLTIYLLTLL